MTFAEMMVAMSIMGIVFLAAAMLQYTAARQTRKLYGESRTMRRVQGAVEHMRFTLAEAMIGTPATANSGRTLVFHNPMYSTTPGTPMSSYIFSDGKLYYLRDTSASSSRTIATLTDVQFRIIGPGRGVEATVQAEYDYAWMETRPYEIVEEFTLRN
jgi:type II secretory pathway pseudopilin PulG